MLRRLLLLLILWSPILANAAEAVLTVLAEERRPYAWRENGVAKGLCYELVVETMRELGLKPEIEFTTFNRGLTLARTQDKMVLFSITPSLQRSQYFKWVGPLVRSDVYIYKLKSSTWKIHNFDDLPRLERIGVPKGMQQDVFLTERGLSNLMRSDTTTHLVQALALQRVDAIALGPLPLAASALELKLDPRLFEQTPVKLYDNPLYIGMSNDISDATVARWQRALNKVKQKHLRALTDKYLHPTP